MNGYEPYTLMLSRTGNYNYYMGTVKNATTNDGDLVFSNNAGTERVRFTDQGNVGIGTTAPASLFSVGASNQFQVNSTGNILKINNVATSFPAAQGAASTLLQNDGAGNLTWQAPAGVPQNCPAGFTLVNAQYCIETNERAAATWWNANTTCVSAGAVMCSFGQWHAACVLTAGLNNMTDGHEWMDDSNTSIEMRLNGNGSCTSWNYATPASSYAYRCCFNR